MVEKNSRIETNGDFVVRSRFRIPFIGNTAMPESPAATGLRQQIFGHAERTSYTAGHDCGRISRKGCGKSRVRMGYIIAFPIEDE